MSVVIFVDDEAQLREAASQSLMLADIAVEPIAHPEAALARLGRQFDGVLVTDIRMPDMDGLTLMARTLEIDPELPVILVTGHGDVERRTAGAAEGEANGRCWCYQHDDQFGRSQHCEQYYRRDGPGRSYQR